MAALHTGKLAVKVETSLTEAMDDHLHMKAASLGLHKADYVRELIYLAETGEIYSVHVAKDRAAGIGQQGADVPQFCGNHKELKP
jgi:hypothetical protein